MRLEYFLVADSIVIDQLTNRVSILQIVDDVTVAGLPCVLPGFSTIAGFADPDEPAGTMKRASLRVSGSAIPEPRELTTSFRSGGAHHRLVYRLELIALEREGELELELLIDGVHLGRRTIDVRRSGPAGSAPGVA
jgi:hypothetical protein